jgi:hypothetical protein
MMNVSKKRYELNALGREGGMCSAWYQTTFQEREFEMMVKAEKAIYGWANCTWKV